jgi:hypothetical protein
MVQSAGSEALTTLLPTALASTSKTQLSCTLQITTLRREAAAQLADNQRLTNALSAKASELQAVAKRNGELDNEVDNLRTALEVGGSRATEQQLLFLASTDPKLS